MEAKLDFMINETKQILSILFDENEHICFGDKFAKDVYALKDLEISEFFSINPLHASADFKRTEAGEIENTSTTGRRADLNVTVFRNFLFEMDNVPLEQQLEIIKRIPIGWTSVVYSGGKSYHAILSVSGGIPNAEPHTQKGVDAYKKTWKQLAAVLARYANMPATIFDTACQNPSRLSRLANFTAPGRKRQAPIIVGTRFSREDLGALLKDAPEIKDPVYISATDAKARSEDQLRLLMPVELLNRLKFPMAWAEPAGMYPELLKLVLWLIDSTGADRETVVNFLSKYTFPGLLRAGYPQEKLMKPIDDAFRKKGESKNI